MRFWFSPLPLPAAVILELAVAGLEPWPNDQGSPHGDTCLLVYDSPERHIAAAAETEAEDGAMFSRETLAEGYSHILGSRETSGQPLLAGWRLQRVGGLGLQQWFAGKGPTSVVGEAEPIKPLVASVMLSLLDTQPRLLEAYNDLELQAELLGSEADLTYRQRLHHAIGQADPLSQLLVALQTRKGELQEARHEAESSRLELNKAQEKLVLADSQNQQLVETWTREVQSLQGVLEALQQELQSKTNNLAQQLQNTEKQLQHSRDDAELTLQQLHVVQEELNRLVQVDGQKQQLLDTRTHKLQSLEANIHALQQELQPKVHNLEQQLQTREKQLEDSRVAAELALQQLQEVQEELKLLALADGEKQLLLENRSQELQNLSLVRLALQQELQFKVNNLEQQLQTREKQLQDSRVDAELTLVQLHQAQEEVEQLFLTDRQKQQLLETSNHELERLQGNAHALQEELQSKVNNLEQQLQTREKQLQDSRVDAELTLVQLHQVQEEVEHLFLTDRQKQQLLETSNHELQRLQGNVHALQQELKTKVTNLRLQLKRSHRDLREARDDGELTLLQLHQVQEELERYFLQTRAGTQLVEAQADQLKRAKRLMTKLTMKDSSLSCDMVAVAVEVLPPDNQTSQQPSMQAQALLNTYASSLDRASALLTRAMRR